MSLTLYHSRKNPGAMMNRYGTVFIPGKHITKVTPDERAAIISEAKEDGWTLRPGNPDVGNVWHPPEHAIPEPENT